MLKPRISNWPRFLEWCHIATTKPTKGKTVLPFVGFVVAMSTMVQETEAQTNNRKARQYDIHSLWISYSVWLSCYSSAPLSPG